MAPEPGPTVLVVHPYWNFWESSVSGDLRADRRAFLDEAIEALSGRFTVRDAGLIDDPVTAAAAASAARHEDVDAVVMVCTMAVPPATGISFLDQLPSVPVVLWAVSRAAAIDADFSHARITTDGAPVGTPMLGSALARAGRAFRVVCSTLQATEEVAREVRCAVAAGQLLRRSILVIGEPIPGYTSVVPPPDDDASHFRPRTQQVAAEEFARLVGEVDEVDLRSRVLGVRNRSAIAEDVDPVGLERAVASEMVLSKLIEEHHCIGGAINCHSAQLRRSPEYGIAPCLALGLLTSAGSPFTCTGDVLTAVAMGAVQALGHPTLYHEIEAIDYANDEVVLSNTGEFDLRLCPTSPVSLVRNVWYQDDEVNAPCATFTIPSGPASLIGFAYAPNPRFIVAEGTFTGRAFPATGMPNAGFRFSSGSVAQSWPRWASAGVLHHSVATNARVGSLIEGVAAHLGVECVHV